MDKQELKEWGERLEAGHTGDPTLELAEEMQSIRPREARPPAEFRRRLKAQLLKSAPPMSTWNRRCTGSGLAISLLLLLVMGFVAVFRQVQPVSAAEILERANANFAAKAQGEGLLYTQFSLEINDVADLDAMGEIWQSQDTEQFMYQLLDPDGVIVYFVQRDENSVWRSVHDTPVGTAGMDSVYLLTADQYMPPVPVNDGEARFLPPVFGDLINWIEVDRWLVAQGQGCEDLFCVLGLADSTAWDCEVARCSLPLVGAEDGLPPVTLEAYYAAEEKHPNGRNVYVLEFRTNPGEDLLRTMKFDSESFDLVEIIGYSANVEVARMIFIERIELVTEAYSFEVLPQGLKEVQWEGPGNPPAPILVDLPTFHPPAGSSVAAIPRIISARPGTGSSISGQVEFALVVTTALGVQEEAELIVRICDASYGQEEPFSSTENCAGLPEVQTRVRKYDGPTRLSIDTFVDESWPATVTVLLELLFDDGRSQIVLASEYFWNVSP